MAKRKRSNGEGSIWKLNNGTWRGQIMDGYTEDGKRNIVSFYGDSKGEVREKIREFQLKLDANVHINKSMTLGEWSDIWYQNYKTEVQASTYSGYRYTLKLLKKSLGEQILHQLLPIQIDQFLDTLVTADYSLSQIKKCRTMLIQIFDAADKNGLVMGNPARKAKIIRDKDGSLSRPRQLKDAFDDSEVEILQKELPSDLMGHSIRVMLGSGIRVQELIALTPTDIAEDGSWLEVSKAIKMVNGLPVLGTPKSKSGYRTIPIPMETRASARFLREHGGQALIWSLPGHNPYYSVGSFRRRYYNALKPIENVRSLSPHCCRHTYVTRLQAKGVSLELIAKLAGHSSIITTDGYAHTSMTTLQSAVALLDKKEVL